jgi:uncharacterized repeat protein (TIGR03847 family)
VSFPDDIDDVDVFTAGAIGQPGARTFFLQARQATDAVTVKCEKQQVEALATYLGQLLSDLPTPNEVPTEGGLTLSSEEEPRFVLGSIGVAWDEAADRVVLALEELVPTDEEGNPDPEADEHKAVLQVRLTRGQALAFSRHGLEVVAAGRPACRYCGLPRNADGHFCPRMN